ncbi:hypothetical protein [Moheibacter lacus]|uniref:Uncharacterized protein n=1 Tax=Moheibacter lacus TaxID=2745851 RepID=A0A838ZKK0_9FLAO|nr:hypothetical protein [Moheibacter lacus]MBA5629778.1 hypothetical protein [Moheibacter lacus]
MKKLKWIFLLIPIISLNAQSNLDEEEIIIQNMCDYLNKNKLQNDSIRVENANVNYLYPYLEKQNESDINGIIDRIYYRYQKQCPEFMAILDKVDPLDTNEATYLNQPEKSVISSKGLREFINHENYYYLFNKEITNVEISNGEWVESFEDGTFSKTKLEWLNEHSFKLIFIESNNIMKNAYSRVGEEYYYEIIKKEENYFILQTPNNQNKYLQFKLYIK